MITTVTGKNQVTIPAKVARLARIRQGSQLDWAFDDKRSVLHVRVLASRGDVARGLLGAGKKYSGRGRDLVAELIAERENDG